MTGGATKASRYLEQESGRSDDTPYERYGSHTFLLHSGDHLSFNLDEHCLRSFMTAVAEPLNC